MKGEPLSKLTGERESLFSARDLLTWNEVFPTFSYVKTSDDDSATDTFSVVADYGWAQRILCSGCYQQDAEAIVAACEMVRGVGALVATTRCYKRPDSKLESDPGPCGKCAACIARRSYYGTAE